MAYVWICPKCGRTYSAPGRCPYCDAPLIKTEVGVM